MFLLAILASLATSSVLADWQYTSRPDLSPPLLNITIPADRSKVDTGYIFVTPYEGFGPGHRGPEQDGPHIYRDDGELVWSGVGYFGGWAINFRPDIYRGQPVLRAFQGQIKPQGRMYGDHVILNERYETIKTFRSDSNKLVSAHEFLFVNNGTAALVDVPIARIRDLREYGGEKGQQWIRSAGFQEVNLETGKVLFEWESLDHVDPKYSALPVDIRSRTSSPDLLGTHGVYNGEGWNLTDAWNYFHLNSIDKDDQGDYLISGRCYNAIFKISGKTGEVLWQLGGGHNTSSFTLDEETRFAFQHDARFISRSSDGQIEVISLHDNSAFNSGDLAVRNQSIARYIQLDHKTKTAKSLKAFGAPYEIIAPSQGNVQTLPNGNLFANWGQGGALTEYTPDGQVIFHAYLDSEPSKLVQSYRGFRFPWIGRPTEPPAIVALEVKDGVDVYVSWNGDTEARSWEFFTSDGRSVGKVKRDGFETSITVKERAAVFAVAYDLEGKELVRTEKVKPEIRPKQELASSSLLNQAAQVAWSV